jgi:Glycoside hydrolase family 44
MRAAGPRRRRAKTAIPKGLEGEALLFTSSFADEPVVKVTPVAIETEVVEFLEAESKQERANLRALTISLRSRLSRPRLPRRRSFRLIGVGLAVLLVLAAVRLSAIFSPADDKLDIQVGNQAAALVDLRQGTPISPYLFGANVFPEISTNAVDKNGTGFMSYGPTITKGLRDAKVKLLRFPGGSWGEEHVLSYDQLNAYGELLAQTGSQGMIQARLSGPESVEERANLAGGWVDYMNNPQSGLRTGAYARAPLNPVRFWTVGNEPDLLNNPDTGKPFTVAEYVADFVRFSTLMHTYDPTIQVFGPEISQFSGIGAGPRDPLGQDWMGGFLTGVGAYESAHPQLKFHLLDDVSFHYYPFGEPGNAAAGLMTNAEEWNYLLPPLRQLVRQSLGRDAPVAVTEINSNATKQPPPPGLAALWWADTLGALMDHEVGYVAFFAAEGVDAPYPLFTSNGLRPTAMLRVLEMFSHLQQELVPLPSERDPISIYATQDAAHRAVSVLFVNKAPVTQLAQVSAPNKLFGVSSWSDLNISLSGYSITLVTLHRQGRAEAYSFKLPASSDAPLAPVIHTICGGKTDALADDIPC